MSNHAGNIPWPNLPQARGRALRVVCAGARACGFRSATKRCKSLRLQTMTSSARFRIPTRWPRWREGRRKRRSRRPRSFRLPAVATLSCPRANLGAARRCCQPHLRQSLWSLQWRHVLPDALPRLGAGGPSPSPHQHPGFYCQPHTSVTSQEGEVCTETEAGD